VFLLSKKGLASPVLITTNTKNSRPKKAPPAEASEDNNTGVATFLRHFHSFTSSCHFCKTKSFTPEGVRQKLRAPVHVKTLPFSKRFVNFKNKKSLTRRSE
ncbi:hypothetical protein ACFQ41_10230, partial [Lacticaseibacillus suilingensis]